MFGSPWAGFSSSVFSFSEMKEARLFLESNSDIPFDAGGSIDGSFSSGTWLESDSSISFLRSRLSSPELDCARADSSDGRSLTCTGFPSVETVARLPSLCCWTPFRVRPGVVSSSFNGMFTPYFSA